MICSYEDLKSSSSCKIDPVFLPVAVSIPSLFSKMIPFFQIPSQIWIIPLQLHTLVFSVFASLVAPFGGFLASGLKRTFKLKVKTC